jgi:flagellar basal-body rod protein FlgC
MYGALDISTSGMIAQRTRLETIMTNIANRDTFLDENLENNPFQRQVAYFAPGDPKSRSAGGRRGGVHVTTIESEPGFDVRIEPNNPYADKATGTVKYPNVNPTVEQLNAYAAQRSYEANLAAADASRAMMTQALRLIA